MYPRRLASAGARVARVVDGTSWTELATPDHGARLARAALLRDPAIAEVAFSYIRHASTLPNDPLWTSTQASYLSPLRLDRAWDLGRGTGVTVAVVDSGTDLSHPDLAGQLVSGYNVLAPGRPPQDDFGHGTLVSGTVAARTNNGAGGVGVAPGAKVMPIKVLNSVGAGTDADIAIGINWARTHHAKVINLSLGGSFDDPMLAQAVHNAIAADVVVVAAAGNDSAETVEFPAAYPGVVAVSATDHAGALASFSSFGWRIDVAAPGLDITSTALGGGVLDRVGDVVLVTDRRGGRGSDPRPVPVVDRGPGDRPYPRLGARHRAARCRSRVRKRHRRSARRARRSAGRAHPSARVGADEPNDTPTDATALGDREHVQRAARPRNRCRLVRRRLRGGRLVLGERFGGAPSLDHKLDPAIELYKPDHSFAASQELAGGDLTFDVTVPGHYFVRVRNVNGSTAAYAIVVDAVAAPPAFAPSLDLDFGAASRSVGIGDVNGDGRDDALVVFGSASAFPNSIVVFTQTPTRSLTLFAELATGAMTGAGLATGDLDGDGSADVVIPVVGRARRLHQCRSRELALVHPARRGHAGRDRRRRRRRERRHRRGRIVRCAGPVGTLRAVALGFDEHHEHTHDGIGRGRQPHRSCRRPPRRRRRAASTSTASRGRGRSRQ